MSFTPKLGFYETPKLNSGNDSSRSHLDFDSEAKALYSRKYVFF